VAITRQTLYQHVAPDGTLRKDELKVVEGGKIRYGKKKWGSVNGPMIFNCSMIDPGQPCVIMTGSAFGAGWALAFGTVERAGDGSGNGYVQRPRLHRAPRSAKRRRRMESLTRCYRYALLSAPSQRAAIDEFPRSYVRGPIAQSRNAARKIGTKQRGR
jgi:hypothetical protein